MTQEADTPSVDRRFEEHTKSVGRFLSELYAIMVDPCASGEISVAETKNALLAAALLQRENLSRLSQLETENRELKEKIARLDSEDATFVLGWPNFRCGPLAHIFQRSGEPIPAKAEAEQAFIIRWLLGLVMEHGHGWEKVASAEIGRRQALNKGPAK